MPTPAEPHLPLHEALGPFAFKEHRLEVSRGYPLPLGASRTPAGINFSVISANATAITLVLCEPCSSEPLTEIRLDPVLCRTGYHWHIRVGGLPADFCYGYRADGPTGPRHRFDPGRILLDPAATALSCGRPWGFPGRLPRLSLVPHAHQLQHEHAWPPPRTPREDTIVYELHVRGYTVHPSSGVGPGGTYAGLVEKIPYLKKLGVTAVELLPVDEFDELDCPFVNPLTGEKLRNFWGYNTVAYAATKAAYAVNPEQSEPWLEFRRMVRAFHEAGIEVILDVVFNHTAEGADDGPTYSFRGLDNALYYMTDDHGRYLNYTGCGNTVNSNHPVVRGMLLDCLRNAVAASEVDGFRFDLASVFGRDTNGEVLVESPVIEMISADSLLADVKLIAEPWDAAGLYQVADFPGGARWSVWNGRYRDDVRRFWRGESNMVPALATRLCGSDDLYATRGPLHSINFITCHDGFTLHDLVSYDRKHNEANGEGNRDGNDANWSWNCGVEGQSDDPEINKLRQRQAKNLIATLLISQGVPMLLGGDEFLRTQKGNNNAWCQDNETSWVDWTLANRHAGFLRFVRQMIALRMRHPVLRRRTFMNRRGSGAPPDVAWHGIAPCEPDFGPESHAIAMVLDGRGCDRSDTIDRDFYAIFNAWREPLTFVVPSSPTGRAWRRTVDTALPTPEDALDLDQGPVIPLGHPYHVEARSVVILVSEGSSP